MYNIFNFVLGTDVSRWQDAPTTPANIDFKKMHAGGVRFVFLKASQSTWMDKAFTASHPLAVAAGLIVGAYHFLDWTRPATEQADYFANIVNRYPIDLPPVLDFEDRYNAPAKELREKAARQFVEVMMARTGRRCIIYTSPSYWNESGSADAYWLNYPLWIAHYTNAVSPIVPAPWKKWHFWQYSAKGDGIALGVESKDIDLDYWNGTLAELYAFVKKPLPPEPPAANEKQIKLETLQEIKKKFDTLLDEEIDKLE